MSNIDKLMEKLKSAALKLNCEQWQTRNGFSGVEVIVKGSVAKGHGCVSYQPVASELVDTKTAKAIALFCPANILALLDELEAKDKTLEARKQGILRTHKMFKKQRDRAAAAEKRIAELEASHSKLRESMAAIHNTIRLDGAHTSLAVILNAAKHAHEESAAATGIRINGEG